ncbi:DNA-binding protein [Salmonella enterica subsp. enterica serovar Vitkin]|uniref:DNA-binding protein n=2 Tax=Salmonella enterica TaxID=28901 RepID=A0A5U2D1A6_SALER|nr:DNA-binding protein [Salmonella enterica subsp. enterica serovar Vitkin]EAP3546855.1 DNA-binding protein [Salmonella enterica]EBH8265921.1 DNA-binding protein [Salmonella enterica subsp. enterica serovar Bareilly]EBQ9477818.1 DNA-binding protein [Salmonella enterica subsp. enterica serovar Kokomlemle]EAV2236723.1 DNA-binding protein [Salmonella enterica]
MSPNKTTQLERSSPIFLPQLAILLNRKQQTIRVWISKDQLPEGLPRPQKMNGRNYWPHYVIEEFLSQNT